MENQDCYHKVTEPKYECVIFDVDDTLYPLSSGIPVECTKNIVEYMINKLQIEEYKVPEMCALLYKDYETTMAGLRVVGYDFDNDDYHILLGIEDCFYGIICFETLNPTHKDVVVDDDFGGLPKSPIVCKPFENAFEQAFKVADVNPRKTLFFDDSIQNLQTAKALGLQTVLVGKPQRPKGVD